MQATNSAPRHAAQASSRMPIAGTRNTEAVSASDDDKGALLARGRLSDARKWFEYRGWDVLPQGIRGQRILRWGAIHAWLASPANPESGVRKWVRRWAPWLKQAELDELVAETALANKRWSSDQCAAVLEVTVRDRTFLGLRFLGANDDPDGEIRLAEKKAKAAARSRKYRAARSTGAKDGRPSLQLSEAERLDRRRAQAADRKRAERARRRAAMGDVTLNPVRDIILVTNNSRDNDIGGVTEFSVTEESRPRQADRRAHESVLPTTGDTSPGPVTRPARDRAAVLDDMDDEEREAFLDDPPAWFIADLVRSEPRFTVGEPA
jgi:hypothetical protein